MRRRGREKKLGPVEAALAAALIVIAARALPAVPAWSASRADAATRPAQPAGTRADLDAARRRVDRLDGEAALTGGRKPYVVLDLEQKVLLVRLMGMTVREIPLQNVAARGFVVPPRSGSAPGSFAVAGIFTLQEKEGDPRLSPLTPEQIEAGLDDENVADALPPEPPSSYALRFKQPVLVRVIGGGGQGAIGGLAGRLRAFWRRLRGDGSGAPRAEAVVAVTLQLDETVARELYRTMIPGERWLVVPPAGLMLPGAGQELPRTIRPPRPIPRPTPPPAAPPGVPFQIPPPVDNETPAPVPGGGEVFPGSPLGGDEARPDAAASPSPEAGTPARPRPPDPAPRAGPPS